MLAYDAASLHLDPQQALAGLSMRVILIFRIVNFDAFEEGQEGGAVLQDVYILIRSIFGCNP